MFSTSPALKTILAAYESQIDSDLKLPGEVLQFQGYHTTIPNGTRVHSTRTALDYAMGLLAEGSTESNRKASAAIWHTLVLQDRAPANRTFGIWPWFFEEPLEKMSPPDWNWADFCGIRLAHILCRYAGSLEPSLRSEIADSLRDAAWSIFRRNVDPGYTNIAVKGGVVALVAGEYLSDPLLLNYGRQRLERFLAHTRLHGGFNEYNSPTYGSLVLVEVERGLLLARDEAARTALFGIHEECWRMLASALHPPTGQLCGPHARAYRDLLTPSQSHLISQGAGITLFRPSETSASREFENSLQEVIVPRIPCPANIRQQILDKLAHPEIERSVHTDFIRSVLPAPLSAGSHTTTPPLARSGTLWSQGDACVGSVNCDNLWQQRRPIIGYWRMGDHVATLRVRLRHQRNDFASGVIRTAQAGSELLSCVSLVTNKADSHDHLDLPRDGIFHLTDLALSIEITAPQTTVLEIPGLPIPAYQLSAGNFCLDLHPLISEFGGHPVTWQAAQTTTGASIRASINHGADIQLCPGALQDVALGFHLRLRPKTEAPAAPTFTCDKTTESYVLHSRTTHSELSVTSPRSPKPLM